MIRWKSRALLFGFLVICIALVLSIKEPVSPAASLPGEYEAFDAILADANSKWSFVFVSGNQVKLSDIYGNDEKVLLDLREATGNQNSRFLDSFSISPDGRFFLAVYRHISNKLSELDVSLLLLDLKYLSTQDVPVGQNDSKMIWFKKTLWLNESTFLIPYLTYKNDQELGKVTLYSYLLKRLYDLESSEIITLPTKHSAHIWHPESSSLLYYRQDESDPSGSVWAIDVDGERLAEASEAEYFKKKGLDELYSPENPVSIEVEKVTDSVARWAKKYRQDHSGRCWICLNGKIVRCAEGGDLTWWRKPVWDKNMNLFTWHETKQSCQVFYMDSEGHYRQWRKGRYCGKIPRNKFGTMK